MLVTPLAVVCDLVTLGPSACNPRAPTVLYNQMAPVTAVHVSVTFTCIVCCLTIHVIILNYSVAPAAVLCGCMTLLTSVKYYMTLKFYPEATV